MAEEEQKPRKPGRHIITPEERRRGVAARTKTLLDGDPDHFKKLGKRGGEAHSARASHQDYVESGREGGETTFRKHGSEHLLG